jgi:GTP-binding protein
MKLLREAKKPTIFVANKADSERAEHEAADLYRLGIDRLLPVSALHGRRVEELEAAIVAALPPPTDDELSEAPPSGLRIAIIGKPNAGKSSLVNRLLGEERMLVDNRPGTTRDAIDTVIERNGKSYIFVDTAGIRRKAKVRKEASAVETASVVQAIRAMERADLVILVADANEGVAEQDAKVLGLAADRGRAVVVALNKIDLLDKTRLDAAETDARDKLSFATWATYSRISTKTGRGIDRLLSTVDAVGDAYCRRIGTGELNRFFEQVIATHPPPTRDGRAPRLFFITQAETRPPTFVVAANEPDKIHFSYQRYVQNQIRTAFGFDGVPVIVHYRKRRRRGEDRA